MYYDILYDAEKIGTAPAVDYINGFRRQMDDWRGAGAEILEPLALQQYVAETVRAVARMYEGERK